MKFLVDSCSCSEGFFLGNFSAPLPPPPASPSPKNSYFYSAIRYGFSGQSLFATMLQSAIRVRQTNGQEKECLAPEIAG